MKRRILLLASAASLIASSAFGQLTLADVQTVINRAVTRAVAISPNSVIAVTDREGYVLGIWNVAGGEPTPTQIANSVSKAGTAAFLSSNQNAFTSRTAGFIIQQHFPDGVRNTAPGPLVGVGFSNLPFSDVNRFKKNDSIATSASPGTLGSPIPGTSLDGSPGGMPLYKNGVLVGGVGVTGDGSDNSIPFIAGYDKDEDVALSGQQGYRPSSSITAGNVFINGISLAYTAVSPTIIGTIVLHGNASVQFPLQAAPPPFPYPTGTFGGVSGQIRQPIISDPMPGMINGQLRLTAAEVTSIINFAADRVRITRAGIRLPIGVQMEAYIISRMRRAHRQPCSVLSAPVKRLILVGMSRCRKGVPPSVFRITEIPWRSRPAPSGFLRRAIFRRASIPKALAPTTDCRNCCPRRRRTLIFQTALPFSPAVFRFIGTVSSLARSASAAMASIKTTSWARLERRVFSRPKPSAPINSFSKARAFPMRNSRAILTYSVVWTA
jgi:uncharacterized protein GlcG (DUF336 family)